MFSNYRTVYWISLVMSLFFFAPFSVAWSTDVWMRFVRITEWVSWGFPMGEVLSYAQNAPFGHEMHWTRPLDVIGYLGAWPFIPTYGLKRAIELMSYFVPILVFAVGLRGFFYGVKGYITPKGAFLAFWLLFWSVGYVWTQSQTGYFDHHVFHFSLLVWVLALVARSFIVRRKQTLMIIAGILTALGTWITAEFFINSYIVLTPFMMMWLLYHKSLKAPLIYTVSYTLTLLVAMIWDHPLSGFMTLDLYRASMFHVVLGGMNSVALLILHMMRPWLSRVLSRLIWGGVMAAVYISILLGVFTDVLIVPMTDPFLYHVWVKKVGEMQPIWHDWVWCITQIFVPVVMGLWGLFTVIRAPRRKHTRLLLLTTTGLIFYALLMVLHIRTGVSVNAFFIFTGALFFYDVFFPREKSRHYTLFFVLLYLLFMGAHTRGTGLVIAFKIWGVNHYLELYENNPDVSIPSYFREEFEAIIQNRKRDKPASEKKETRNTSLSLNEKMANDHDFQCSVFPKSIREKIIQDRQNGVLLTDIFDAPQIVWETGKPVLGGPYHTNISGLTDLTMIFLDQPPYERARQLVQKRDITQVYLTNPRCQNYWLSSHTQKDSEWKPERFFFYAVYYDMPEAPDWLKLEYEDSKTKAKLFRVSFPDQVNKEIK